MSPEPFDNSFSEPEEDRPAHSAPEQKISFGQMPFPDALLGNANLSRTVCRDLDKPSSLLLTGISEELVECALAEAGFYINPNSLKSICRSILLSESIDPELLKYCVQGGSDYSASQRRTFKSCRNKFIDHHCGVLFENDDYAVSIDKYFTNRKNRTLSAEIRFKTSDAQEAWATIENLLSTHYNLNLNDELAIYSAENTIWDAGHAQFLVTDDIFISTEPLVSETEGPEAKVLVLEAFEDQWIPGKIQLTGIDEVQISKIIKLFHSKELAALDKSGFIINALQAAVNSSIPDISRLWPLQNPLKNLTTLDISKVVCLREKDPRHSGAAPYPFYEVNMHSFQTDIGEVQISFKPYTEKSPNVLQVQNTGNGVYLEHTAVFAISWDAAGMSEEEVRSAWEIVSEIAEILQVKTVRKKLADILMQPDMPEMSAIDSDIGQHMRLSLQNSLRVKQ